MFSPSSTSNVNQVYCQNEQSSYIAACVSKYYSTIRIENKLQNILLCPKGQVSHFKFDTLINVQLTVSVWDR